MELLFSSRVYDFLTEDEFKEALHLSLQLMIRQPKGQVAFYVPLAQKSHSNKINHHNDEFIHGKPKSDLLTGILNIYSDFFKIYKDSQDNLVVEYYNEDTINTVQWCIITESDKDEHNKVKQGSYKKYVEYLQERPTVKVK